MDASSSYFSSLSDPMSFNNIAEDSQLLGLSLQEMIESDIKVDFDDIHCTNSFSGSFGAIDTSDLFSDINIRIEDGLLAPLSPLTTPSSKNNASLWSTSSNSYGYTSRDVSLMEDITGATGLMVNPINQMPVGRQPKEKLSQITVSTNQHLGNVQQQQSRATFMQHSPQTSKSGQGFSGVITSIPAFGKSVMGTQPQSKPLKILPPISSPLQQVPSPSRKRNASSKLISSNGINITVGSNGILGEGGFPKPAYSYSCLIALALKNSRTGSMSVSEIYKFMCEHFPYFKTAPSGWKNSVRHNLSLNKSFEKIEKPNPTGSQRKGCLWTMNPAKITKMDDEVAKWAKKDLIGIKRGMINPDSLELLERGEMKRDYGCSVESEDDEDPRSPESVTSQDSQSDDQQGSELGDGEGFTAIQESALQELNLQISGGIFDELESTGATFSHGNYSISSVVHGSNDKKPYNLLVLHKQDGQKIFSI